MTRLEKALANGWGFASLKITDRETSRHSMWVQRPEMDTWKCLKVDGTSKDPVNDILDYAGVQEYDD